MSKKIKKIFLWQDNSGRGKKPCEVKFENIADDHETINYDGVTLAEWAANADFGDEFENSTESYTRINP